MANDVKFKLNLQGLNELMKSPEIQSALDTAGEAVAGATGGEYSTSAKTGRYIGFCNVYPDSVKAIRDNYTNNTLLKAVSAVGLPMEK